MEPKDVQAQLAPLLGASLLGVDAKPGTAGFVRFAPADATKLFEAVRDLLGFRHLSMVGGIDWGDHREVVYVAWSDSARQYLHLSTDLPASDPTIETATSVWPAANWHERETWELVGITFRNHPDLRRLLTPDGYAFQPLLRSFKLHEPEELEVKARNV